MKTIFQWFVYSSTNSAKLSLTLKGFLPFLALLGLGSYTADATTAIDSVVNLIVIAGQFVTAFVAFIGIIRKIYNTATSK